MKKTIIILLLLLFFLKPLAGFSETLTLAVTERDWYPFSYRENGVTTGMHVDLVRAALVKEGFGCKILRLPSRRSIKYAETGRVDGIISIAWSKAVSGKLDFPSDAAISVESKWRIMQVDHVIVTHRDDPFEFEGDIGTIPNPIRIPLGAAFVEQLEKSGHLVYETRTDLQSFRMLERDKKGTVITTSLIAEKMFGAPEFKNRITIQAVPLFSGAYHLAFSKSAPLTDGEKKRIWDAIARLRNDYVFMLQLFAKY